MKYADVWSKLIFVIEAQKLKATSQISIFGPEEFKLPQIYPR